MASKRIVDIATIVRAPTLQVSVNYVLIAEWLGADDHDRTGCALAATLTERLGKDRVVFRECASAADVERAIRDALQAIPTRGIPVLHIETHGERLPLDGTLPGGFVGPDGRGGTRVLPM